MNKKSDVLCEIIFTDHKLNILISRIGTINEAQLSNFYTNSREFIIFRESYNPPIFKNDIKEIIVHQDRGKIYTNESSSKIIKYVKAQNKVKIS
ncbi:MAG: hypothetical protein JSV62_14235 [Promethearchaeota archaeon]|nr:MAG: hypothetical protein JSV62_14235 [Candidatus Lokiarchaeota archaeon]